MITKSLKLKKIDLSKMGRGDKNCEHPDINGREQYLVNYDGALIIGKFSRQWYGWSFSWFGSAYAGLQLDSFKEVWEIVK